jgi:transcriptional regulator with XRE-family HTH domain
MKTLLKNAREKKGLKTREVAELLKIDQALISKFENGLRNPTKKQIVQLAQLLEIDLETIMVLWLKEKILHQISGEEFGVKALVAAQSEIDPESIAQSKPDADPLQKLLDEMDALKHKFENLRGS